MLSLRERKSFWALNGLNFFLAQIAAVVVPFLNVFLRQHEWRYDEIGLAMAVAGLGSVLFQIPAGIICDRFSMPKKLLIFSTITLGLSYVLIPHLADNLWALVPVLFISGMVGTFFAPLLSTLALSLVGRANLHKILGTNQSWGHIGGVGAALVAAAVVRAFGLNALFYLAGIISLLAAGCVGLVSGLKPIDQPEQQPELRGLGMFKSTKKLLKDPEVRTLLFCLVLFYLSNGPSAPTVGLYMKALGSPDEKIAWISLVAQPIMIPVAMLAGRYGARWGRKPLMMIALFALPLRWILYACVHSENQVLAITAIDGITSGISALVIVLMCSDLTNKKGLFNSLMGLINSVPALGAVLGVAMQGVITQYYGFHPTFFVFAGIALVGAVYFWLRMPETQQHLVTATAPQVL
jgi:MFS family permease